MLKKNYRPKISHTHHIVKGLFFALLKSFVRPIFLGLTLFSFAVILGCAALMLLFESAFNPGLQTYFDAVYFSVSTLTTTGFGDIAPVTSAGKVLSMAMMLLGTAIFVSFTAVLSSGLVEMDLELTEFLVRTDRIEQENPQNLNKN